MMETPKLVGVRNRTVIEVKHKDGSFNASLDESDLWVGAIAHDLYKLGKSPGAKDSKLNVGSAAAETRVTLDTVKKYYQEELESLKALRLPEPLKKKEILLKAREVHLRLNELSRTEGRRREDVAAIPPLVVDAVRYQANLTAETLQQYITSFEEAQRACDVKDAKNKKLERACKVKVAENKELRRRLKESKKACKEKDAKIRASEREIEELKLALEEATLANIDADFLATIDVCMRENPLPEFSGEFIAANFFS